MSIVFTKFLTAKQGAGRAECKRSVEGIDRDYATGADGTEKGQSGTPVPTIISKLLALHLKVCYNESRKAVEFMKKTLLPAIIMQAVYYILSILSLFDYEYSGRGYGLAFVFWIASFLPAFFCILFHILGAILNITRGKAMFSIIYLVLAILALPLLVIIGTSASVIHSIVWNIYFGVLFFTSLCFFFNDKLKAILSKK